MKPLRRSVPNDVFDFVQRGSYALIGERLMVVVMQEGVNEGQIQQVIDRLVSKGFDVHRSTGESHTGLGAVGVHPDYDPREIELLDGERQGARISQPYKLASREFRPARSIVLVGKAVPIGGADVVVM